MCSTKDKIASALRQLCTERPVQKITVQNLMDASNMKRQSFYYHFKDIHDVLLWIYTQEIITPMLACTLPFDKWLLHGLKLLDRNKEFYQKVLPSIQPDVLYQHTNNLLTPKFARHCYGIESVELLDVHQKFVINFFTRAAVSYAIDFVLSRNNLDEDTAMEHIQNLLSVIQPAD